jgi:NhaA family Na+:H+ antiporter
VFSTADLSFPALGAALVVFGMLGGLNAFGYGRLLPYLVLGVLLWVLVLKSGVHATLAGVALAMTIPLRPSPGRSADPASPLHILEHALQPWVAFLIVPVFGFANAGVSLSDTSWAALLGPVPLGIAAGLFVGKQLGVFLATWAAVKLEWADCPEHASWAQVYGVSLLCGIGFTMSLFVGLLAFPTSPELQDEVKIGVLMGSVLSAVVGAVLLRITSPEPYARTERALP